ncbi:hypothetical protein AKO1_011021 [Acrasis kona]|uniref:RGS domain-containing protein n=1 Tax=Acrasis kona TaxID=1008807 RepID=A0AAW2YTR8_9EUKA
MTSQACGHIGSTTTDECSLCKKINKTLNKDAAPKILKKILEQHVYVVLIFTHGPDCQGCNAFLDNVSSHSREYRQMRGDVFAVSTVDRKDVLMNKRNWHDYIGAIQDNKGFLSKKFNINAPKTKVHSSLTAKKSFFQKLKIVKHSSTSSASFTIGEDIGAVTPRDSLSVDHDNTQPSILVIKNDEEVMFSWSGTSATATSPIDARDPYDSTRVRVTSADLVNIIRFYFQSTTIPLSIKTYIKNNSESVFEQMLGMEESRKILVDYLKKEFCAESLEFCEEVEQMEGNVEDMPKQRLLGIIIMIYHTYISDNAPKEVNLPGEIKKTIVERFRRVSSLDNLSSSEETSDVPQDEIANIAKGDHIFSPAYVHVKWSMRENSFMRLINSKEFMTACSKVIPKCFVSRVPYAQPIVCKGV